MYIVGTYGEVDARANYDKKFYLKMYKISFSSTSWVKKKFAGDWNSFCNNWNIRHPLTKIGTTPSRSTIVHHFIVYCQIKPGTLY